MSTVPGDETWRDAGLGDQDEIVTLADELRRDPVKEAEEYRPNTARPDLAGRATEADVIEQAADAPGDDERDS